MVQGISELDLGVCLEAEDLRIEVSAAGKKAAHKAIPTTQALESDHALAWEPQRGTRLESSKLNYSRRQCDSKAPLINFSWLLSKSTNQAPDSQATCSETTSEVTTTMRMVETKEVVAVSEDGKFGLESEQKRI